MTTASEVRYILAEGRSSQVDWMPAGTATSRIATSLVGMANSQGGSVIIGVSPRTNRVHGVTDPEATVDRVLQATQMAEPPLVIPFPEQVQFESQTVVLVRVPAGLPHVYALEGRYFIHDGPVTGPLSAPRLRRLLLERGEASFESEIVKGCSLEDLEGGAVEAYLEVANAPPNADPWQILLGRGCVATDGDALVPSVAGLLLFGQDPLRWFPQADLLAARFSGRTVTDKFVRQIIRGTLIEQLKSAEIFLRDQLREVIHLDGMRAQSRLEYPMEAVRELLVNAIAHRDYSIAGDGIRLYVFSDRLEVHSPGRLPGPVTVDNLIEARFSRNPVIVQVLADMGYIERLGYGIDRVISLANEWGLRRPLFEETSAGFSATLYASDLAFRPDDGRGWLNQTVSHRQRLALDYVSRHGRITNREYLDLSPAVHPETIRRDLADLVSRGILLKVGDRRGTYYILKQASQSDG